jgi:hypothetical protein
VPAAWAADQSRSATAAVQPAPRPARLSDGEPNWTGFWTRIGGLLDRNFGPGGAIPPISANAAGSQDEIPPHAALKSPYKERYERLLKASREGKVLSDPPARCLPPGMPDMMGAVYGLEILQTAGQVTLTSEWGPESRRIWTDGRKHPDPDDVLPSYGGHSIGHWEGDVLVADTMYVREDVRLDESGLPHSANMRLKERFYSPMPGILVDEITIDDPTAYVAPWKIIERYRYRPELSLEEYVCEENNRNVGPNGEPVFNK